MRTFVAAGGGPAIHAALAFAHVVATAAWVGGMGYGIVVVSPAAERFFGEDGDLQMFLTTVALRARRLSAVALAATALSGVGLVAVDDGLDAAGAALVAGKVLVLGAASALLWHESWRMWPGRVFVETARLTEVRRALARIALVLLVCGVVEIALGVALAER